ncbi:MAG: FAD-dependent oxidoreductase [Acetobacteraceae bacterium]
MNGTLAADVVVIGGGLAGHCAALEAAESGADVLLLEKQPEIGGSTVLSGGSFAFAGTDMQRAAGIEDSPDLLYGDLRAVGQEHNDPALVRLYADRQLDAYAWLRARDVRFGPIQISSGQSVPRLHPSNPREVIRLLHLLVRHAPNIRVLFNAPARRLERGAGGSVDAVLVSVDGRAETVRARRGVVLGSGGFSRNPELIETFVPEQRRAGRIGGPGNMGDGLRMAWRLGAGFRDMGYVKGTFGNHPDAGPEQHTAMLGVYKGAIALNRLGQRFVNEALSYKTLGDACLRQPDGLAFQILDQAIMDQSVDGVPIFDFERRLREGLLLRADTLVALAGRIGVDPAVMIATIEDYNATVAAGRPDPFGRTGLSLGYGALPRIERAPFYAYPSTSAIVATYCGLTVDTSMRVLDVEGAAIPGLYAAGEVTGGFHGSAYMTGTSLGKSVICGRLAGRRASAVP